MNKQVTLKHLQIHMIMIIVDTIPLEKHKRCRIILPFKQTFTSTNLTSVLVKIVIILQQS